MPRKIKDKSDMDVYLARLRKVSTAIWNVFREAAMNHRQPEMSFRQIEEAVEGQVEEEYAKKYLLVCRTELKFLKDPMQYIREAQEDTGKAWNLLKTNVEALYDDRLKDEDWSRISEEAAMIAYDRKGCVSEPYAKQYPLICIDELDRCYRRVNGIKEDWYKFIAPVRKEVKNCISKE